MKRLKSFGFFAPFLIAHILLVIVHAGFNSKGLINSWEFGGYAMYTDPYPRVKHSFGAIQPEVELPKTILSTKSISRRLSEGGCLFAFSDKSYLQIARDMDEYGLDVLELVFENLDFSDDKSVLVYKEMSRIQAVRDADDGIQIKNMTCGISEENYVSPPS